MRPQPLLETIPSGGHLLVALQNLLGVHRLWKITITLDLELPAAILVHLTLQMRHSSNNRVTNLNTPLRLD